MKTRSFRFSNGYKARPNITTSIVTVVILQCVDRVDFLEGMKNNHSSIEFRRLLNVVSNKYHINFSRNLLKLLFSFLEIKTYPFALFIAEIYRSILSNFHVNRP